MSTEGTILAYLRGKLPRAENLRLSGFVQAAGGWSHETYVFDAHWVEEGAPVTRPTRPTADPRRL